MKSVSFVSLKNTIDSLFSIIKSKIKVPLHKRFNMSKEEFVNFKKRLYSRDINMADYARLIAVYQSVQCEYLIEKFNQYKDA